MSDHADGTNTGRSRRAAETDEVLGSQLYRLAFEAVMSGTEAGLLPEDQREALRRARELTSTPAPGLPMPVGADPARPAPGAAGGDRA